MKKVIHIVCIFFAVGLTLLTSCKKEEPGGPPIAGIFYSIANKQVAFTALTKRADSWLWDFGDGQTSTEMNPVHVYAEGGVYDVTLKAIGSADTAAAAAEVSLALSNIQMLTGGIKAVNGKKWKISSAHSSKDAFCLADDNFTVVQPIGTGMLGNVGLGLPEVYDDIFTFKLDGSYMHAPVHGGAFAGLVFTMLTGKTILKATPTSQSFGLCYTAWTPAAATFTLNEGKDLAIATVSTDGNTATNRTYKNVMTLTFSGTEFVGFMDFTRECIVQEITPTKMRLAMFVATTQKPANYSKPSYVAILTFELVP
jgi:PKD repeat protein